MNRMETLRSMLPPALLTLLCITALLTGCCSFSFEPPTVEDVEEYFEDNQQEILTIVDYLTYMPADDIFIDAPYEKVFSDFSYITIDDPEVTACVERLWKHGCTSITKMADHNAICFTIWSRVRDEAWCGFVLSMDGENLPEVQCCTQILPLSDNGWFYYLAEYNLWRVQSQASKDASD